MKSTSTFTVVFEDGSEQTGLTYDEADKAMEEGYENGNRWVRAYVETDHYKNQRALNK